MAEQVLDGCQPLPDRIDVNLRRTVSLAFWLLKVRSGVRCAREASVVREQRTDGGTRKADRLAWSWVSNRVEQRASSLDRRCDCTPMRRRTQRA
jgi:hypothetical protein